MSKADIVVSDLFIKELVTEILRIFMLNTESFDILIDRDAIFIHVIPEHGTKILVDKPLKIMCRNGVYFTNVL